MYVKTKWEDRLVEFPNKYKDQNDKEYIFTQMPGQVTKEGTPVIAEKLNNIENGIYNNQLFCYQLTLLSTNWTLNETTNLYEYNVIKEDITENTYIRVIGDSVNREKLSDLDVNSYDGYYILTTTDEPKENVDVTVYYQLTVSANTVDNSAENTDNVDTGGVPNVGEE